MLSASLVKLQEINPALVSILFFVAKLVGHSLKITSLDTSLVDIIILKLFHSTGSVILLIVLLPPIVLVLIDTFIWIKAVSCTQILRLLSSLKKRVFPIYPTSADVSHQNGPVKRAHQIVAKGMCAFLLGSAMSIKFWPYAFKHYL